MEVANHDRARILIVDDNPENLQVLGGVLRSNHFDVEFSTSGVGALNWLETETFDLILLDIMMPELDGFQTCKKIRERFGKNDLPIIFLTAKTDKESVLTGFDIGAQDYITKPFDSRELLARVNTHVELAQARKELKNMNEVLEEKVKERTRQLHEANLELSELDEVKGEFLNILSHEIRSPLNGIKGSLQLLKVRIENADLVKLINILDVSVGRLEQFSYTALLITRLRARKFRLELSEVHLRSEFEFGLLTMNTQINEKELSVVFQEMDTIQFRFDKDLLHEVLSRLLDNSIKYSSKKGEIVLQAQEDEEHVRVTIKDQGTGFPKKILSKRPRLFSSGEKHVNRNMGLNLYLSSLIMDYLGGNIQYGNNPEGGAYVTLDFPKTIEEV